MQAEPVQVQGDVALIGGRPWPANVQACREALPQRMQREGYAHTLEAGRRYCIGPDEARAPEARLAF